MMVDDVAPQDIITPTPRRNFKEMLLRKFQSENPSLTTFPSIDVFMQYLLQMYNLRLHAVEDATNFGMLGGEFPAPISQEQIEERQYSKPQGRAKSQNKRPIDTLIIVLNLLSCGLDSCIRCIYLVLLQF